MTLKAFTQKYGISYTLVAEAALHVPTEPTLERDHDFVEEKLYNAVLGVAEGKRKAAYENVNKYTNIIRKVREIHG